MRRGKDAASCGLASFPSSSLGTLAAKLQLGELNWLRTPQPGSGASKTGVPKLELGNEKTTAGCFGPQSVGRFAGEAADAMKCVVFVPKLQLGLAPSDGVDTIAEAISH